MNLKKIGLLVLVTAVLGNQVGPVLAHAVILPPSEASDVVVPVPGDMQPLPPAPRGILKVSGVAGAGQKSEFKYTLCQEGPGGSPVQDSCAFPMKSAKLNVGYSMKAGLYLLSYSYNTKHFVRVAPGKTHVVELRKLRIPRVSGQIEAKVILDVTEESMQRLVLNAAWGHGYAGNTVREWCRANPSGSGKLWRDGCAAVLQAVEPMDFKDTLVIFNPDATAIDIQFEADGRARWGGVLDEGKASQLYVHRSKDGEFVSVFPGIYAVVFKAPDETVSTTYGIKVD